MPTVSDLGAAVKRKYPGAYDDLGDAELGSKIKQKYPAYSDYEDEELAHKFSSTQVDLPAAIAAKLIALGRSIPDADLAEDGRETEVHVTVKYGLHTSDAEQVRKVLAGEPPVTLTLGKVSIFPAKETETQRGGDQYDVVKVDIDSADLRRLNKRISDALPVTDTHPTYQPHATIAYVKPGLGKKYAGNPALAGQTATIDRIVFSSKDGKKTEIPLGSPTPIPEAPDSLAIQVEQLTQGKRRAVLFTPGAKIPAKPAGINRLDTDQGVFFYNPAEIGARSIKRAVRFDRLGEILGGPQGYGAPEKGELQGPQVAVVAKQGGKDVQAVASDRANLPRAVAAARQVGDSVRVEDPKQAILRRITGQAKQGIEINRGSSTEIPLNAQGRREASRDAQRIARHSPPDRILSSDSVRATQTAAALSKRSGVPVKPTANLESWAQGNLEGRPAQAVKSQIDELLRDGRKVPAGQGPATKRAGESFDAFCKRYLGEMAQIMAEWRRDPSKTIAVVSHSQGIKVLKGWLAKGMPADFSIDKKAMRASSGETGGVELWRPDRGTLAKMNFAKPRQPGILIVRHGSTDQNIPGNK